MSKRHAKSLGLLILPFIWDHKYISFSIVYNTHVTKLTIFTVPVVRGIRGTNPRRTCLCPKNPHVPRVMMKRFRGRDRCDASGHRNWDLPGLLSHPSRSELVLKCIFFLQSWCFNRTLIMNKSKERGRGYDSWSLTPLLLASSLGRLFPCPLARLLVYLLAYSLVLLFTCSPTRSSALSWTRWRDRFWSQWNRQAAFCFLLFLKEINKQ